MTSPASRAATGEERRPWGLMVEFAAVEPLLAAAARVRDAGFTRWDVHTPFPVHGLNDAMGLRLTRLPWFAMGGGLVGGSGALLMQWWTSAVDYPVIVSGKPFFSLPAFIPITFELTILFAAIGAFLGMLLRNGLPRLHHPLFRSERFRRVTTDRFFIVIEADDPRFDPRETRALLESLGGGPVEELED